MPGSADDSSTLHLMQVGVQFGTAVRVPMDLEPKKCTEAEEGAAAVGSGREVGSIHVDLDFDC